MKKLNKKGFTIVELVIVIAVIAILASVLIPTFSGVVEKANKSAAMQASKNAYTNYLAENAEDLTGEEDYVFVSDDYAFKAENEQFNTTAYTKVKDTTTDDGVYVDTTNSKVGVDSTEYIITSSDPTTTGKYAKVVSESGASVTIYQLIDYTASSN